MWTDPRPRRKCRRPWNSPCMRRCWLERWPHLFHGPLEFEWFSPRSVCRLPRLPSFAAHTWCDTAVWLIMWVFFDTKYMIRRYTFRFSLGLISSNFFPSRSFNPSLVMANSLAHCITVLNISRLSACTTMPPINAHTATIIKNLVILIALTVL